MIDTISPRRNQWGTEQHLLSLKVALEVQESVLLKARVGLPIGCQ